MESIGAAICTARRIELTMPNTILVTGATGLLGNNIVRMLVARGVRMVADLFRSVLQVHL